MDNFFQGAVRLTPVGKTIGQFNTGQANRGHKRLGIIVYPDFADAYRLAKGRIYDDHLRT